MRPPLQASSAPPVRRLAALFLVLLAVLAVSWSAGGPAVADDGYEPDPQVISDVWSYAQETDGGYEHVLRWMRVLKTFDELQDMTASEAQQNADKGWERWGPVAAELEKLEDAPGDYEPDQQVVADVRSYAQETDGGYEHVLRWMRTLKSFGALDDMTASEAQGYADRGWDRWEPVADELAELEASTAEPGPGTNRAPVVDTSAANHASFTAANNAPRGILVSKRFQGIFTDPDGDDLTYAVSLPGEQMHLVDTLQIHDGHQRVFFRADADDDWDALDPALPEQFTVTATLTATDPGGLSASVRGDFLIRWEPACDLAAPEDVTALGIEKALVAFWSAPSVGDDCRPTGYTIEARSLAGGLWTSANAGPRATSHVLRGLTPGMHEYRVRARYPRGESDAPLVPKQTDVPPTCDITLDVRPWRGDAVGWFWDSHAGMPSGCVHGPEIEFHIKRSADDYWTGDGRFLNGNNPDPTQPDAIFFSMEPYVSYDFRIVAVDAGGQEHESNVASATIVSNDPSVTADANSPGEVRVYADNNSGALVSWGEPTVAAGRGLRAYIVEWTSSDGVAVTEEVPFTTETHHPFTDRRLRITGLTDGEDYTVRVAARTSPDAAPASTSDAWSVPAPAVTAWSEPTQVWFDSTTPVYAASLGRLLILTDSNKRFGPAVCSASSSSSEDTETVNCPSGTIVNPDLEPGDITVTATHTFDGVTTASTSVSEEGGSSAFPVYASGGNSKAFVVWGELNTAFPAVGTIDAYIIQHRMGTSGGWTNTVITDTTKREHTVSLTPLNNQMVTTWQIRMRARSASVEDHDDNPDTPDETVHRLGFTSDIVTVTTFILYNKPPRMPNNVRVTPGDSQSLIVEWEPPEQHDRSTAHAYQVRHRLRSDTAADFVESEILYPVQTRRICGEEGECENPRRYEITGLTAGEPYIVEVRARNANGWGEWVGPWSGNIPND